MTDEAVRRRTRDSHGYSPLDQVTRDDVDELRLAWAGRVADPERQQSVREGNHQTTPLVPDGGRPVEAPVDARIEYAKDDGYTLRTAAAIASHASRRTRRDEATFIRMWPSPPLP